VQGPDVGDTNPFPETHIQSASLPQYNVTVYQFPLWKPKSAVSASSGSFTTLPSSGSLSSATTGYHPFVLPKPQTFGPLTMSANGSLGETYQRVDEQNHATGNGSFTLSDAINLSRNWSFTPTVTPSLSWQDKFNPVPPPPAGSTTPVSTVG